MNWTWQIRRYREGDEKQILRLRHLVFGDLDPVRISSSAWNWQFLKNPAGKAFCCIAEESGIVVGQYAAIPTRFLVQGQEMLLAFSCDTMVHPAYRKEGIFVHLASDLYRWMESECRISTVWGFPNEVSLPGFTKHLGWNKLTVFPLRVIPIRPLATLKSHFQLPKRAKLSPSLKRKSPAFGKINEIGEKPHDLQIEPISHFDAEFDELWNRNKTLAPVMQIRDSIYLNWRYLGLPTFGYRPFAIKCRGRLTGYMVMRLMNLRGHYFGAIVDLFPFPMGDDTITASLFRFARDYCKGYGAEFLTCLLSQADSRFLKKVGFISVPAGLNPKKWYFACRYGDENKSILECIDQWYITYGDTDIV